MLHDFEITYRDGSTQNVTADSHKAEGEWVSFYDVEGQVLRIPGKDVLGIARASVPDRETPAPMIG